MNARTRKDTRLKTALASLLVLALLALVLQSLVFSGASFTSGSRNTGNAFAAGTLSHIDSKSGQVVLAASGLRPGQSASGTLTLTGAGDFSAKYSLSVDSLVDTPASPALSGALQLTIDDMTTGAAVQEWSGLVRNLGTVTLDTIAPGAVRTYRFTLSFPTANAVSGLQDAAMTLRLRFTGVQQ
jgi:hypothetical protein